MLRIWCNARFSADAAELLRKGTVHHQLLFANAMQESNLASGQPDPQLREADVVFGQIDPEDIGQAPHLQWIHLTTAGYERYDRADFRLTLQQRGAVLTSSSTVYAEPCAEHGLAMMLALARQLPWAFDNQRTEHAWPAAAVRSASQLLAGKTALLLGYGAIARRLIELLAPFRMQLFAIRRSVQGDETIPTYPESELDRLLPRADHVVNLLPGGTGTQTLITRTRFEFMKPTALFYNIGRGSTVDQEGLLRALNSGTIAGAYLDVTSPEPLPKDHPLWSAPNCFITPHTAGGQRDESLCIVQHFLDNLHAYTAGQPLKDRIM